MKINFGLTSSSIAFIISYHLNHGLKKQKLGTFNADNLVFQQYITNGDISRVNNFFGL